MTPRILESCVASGAALAPRRSSPRGWANRAAARDRVTVHAREAVFRLEIRRLTAGVALRPCSYM